MSAVDPVAVEQPDAAAEAKPKKKRVAKAKVYGPLQVHTATGVYEWQIIAACKAGLIRPDGTPGAPWTQVEVDAVIAAKAEILALPVEELPVGANKAASRLAERTGLAVDKPDVVELADAGVLPQAGEFKGYPTYDVGDIDALDVALLEPVVAERLSWVTSSLDLWGAADRLGWRRDAFLKVVSERGITTGRFGRYAIADLDLLRADEELMDSIAAARLIGPEQAARYLEIARRDFNYCTAAGWVAPAAWTTSEVSNKNFVDVPLYRVGDLDDLKARQDIPWEEVRSVAAGKPSRLREFVRIPAQRADIIHAWCDQLADEHGIEVFRAYRTRVDQWEIDWTHTATGGPTIAEVKAAVGEHPQMAEYHRARQLRLDTEVGETARWARRMLERGAAVVLDTETTGLEGSSIIEIAVLDAYDGTVLQNTLVRATQPIEPGAYRVHGLTDADLIDAPTWEDVLPDLLRVTEGRQILAYNSEFDRARVLGDCHRAGLSPAHLAPKDNWGCLMNARSTWARAHYRIALGGGHRALGDARDALEVLHHLVTPPGHRPRHDHGRRPART